MDIIVTLPKVEQQNAKKEEKFADGAIKNGEDVVQYWSIGRKPKALNPGDKVYFIENGFIKYYHIFIKYVENAKCQVTNRTWGGVNLMMKYPPVKLNKHIPMKGFQGFRYVNFNKDIA